MAKIDDQKIKELIGHYQKTGESFSEIANLVAKYIYNFPQKRFSEGSETCSEFFLYFFERFDKLLMKYNERECRFTTWLVVVLRNHYLNWVKKNNRHVKMKVSYIEDFLTHNSDEKQEMEISKEDQNKTKEEVLKTINNLPSKVKIALKLHYFDFFEGQDLQEISKIYKKELGILMSKYDHILESVASQYQKENELIDKINSVYSDLLHYQEKIKNQELSLNQENQESDKLDKLQNRHQNLVKQYRRFYVSVKNELISDFLGTSLNNVHNLIYRGKILLKQKLMDSKLC